METLYHLPFTTFRSGCHWHWQGAREQCCGAVVVAIVAIAVVAIVVVVIVVVVPPRPPLIQN